MGAGSSAGGSKAQKAQKACKCSRCSHPLGTSTHTLAGRPLCGECGKERVSGALYVCTICGEIRSRQASSREAVCRSCKWELRFPSASEDCKPCTSCGALCKAAEAPAARGRCAACWLRGGTGDLTLVPTDEEGTQSGMLSTTLKLPLSLTSTGASPRSPSSPGVMPRSPARSVTTAPSTPQAEANANLLSGTRSEPLQRSTRKAATRGASHKVGAAPAPTTTSTPTSTGTPKAICTPKAAGTPKAKGMPKAAATPKACSIVGTPKGETDIANIAMQSCPVGGARGLLRCRSSSGSSLGSLSDVATAAVVRRRLLRRHNAGRSRSGSSKGARAAGTHGPHLVTPASCMPADAIERTESQEEHMILERGSLAATLPNIPSRNAPVESALPPLLVHLEQETAPTASDPFAEHYAFNIGNVGIDMQKKLATTHHKARRARTTPDEHLHLQPIQRLQWRLGAGVKA